MSKILVQIGINKYKPERLVKTVSTKTLIKINFSI